MDIKKIYEEILEDPNYSRWKTKGEFFSIRPSSTPYPISLAYHEAQFIYDVIIKYKLKNGYEIGRGLGVSSIVAGLALKNNLGRLISIDLDLYVDLIIKYKLENIICDVVGRSPNEVLLQWALESTKSPYTKTKKTSMLQNIEYILIDGEHTGEAIKKDFNSILPYLSSSYIIFFHDSQVIGRELTDYIEEKLGERLIRPAKFLHCNGGICLSYISNLEIKI